MYNGPFGIVWFRSSNGVKLQWVWDRRDRGGFDGIEWEDWGVVGVWEDFLWRDAGELRFETKIANYA